MRMPMLCVLRRRPGRSRLRVGPRPPTSEVPWGEDTRFSVSLDALDAVLQTVGYKCVATEGIRVEHLEFKLDAPRPPKVIVEIVGEPGKTPVLCRFCPSRQGACSHCGDISHVRLRTRQQEQPAEEGAQPDGEDIEEAGHEEEAHEEKGDDGSHDADDDEDDDDGDEADDDEEGDGGDREEEDDDEESKEEGARGDVAAADDDDGNGGPPRPHKADDDYRKEEDERRKGATWTLQRTVVG